MAWQARLDELITLEPAERSLWEQFRACQKTEMIITKGGRCLFPLLRFRVCSGERSARPGSDRFSAAISIERHDDMKWKFKHQRWSPVLASREASTSAPPQLHRPHDTHMHLYEPSEHGRVLTWEQLLGEGLHFAKVKLTNRREGNSAEPGQGRPFVWTRTAKTQAANYFALTSFAHYVPVVYVLDWMRMGHFHPGVPVGGIAEVVSVFGAARLLAEGCLLRSVQEECSFIAVTHYQNPAITELKKLNNPHAKGFILPDQDGFPVQRRGRRRVPAAAHSFPTDTDAEAEAEAEADEKDPMPETMPLSMVMAMSMAMPMTQTTSIPADVLMASIALEKMSSRPLSGPLQSQSQSPPIQRRGRPRYRPFSPGTSFRHVHVPVAAAAAVPGTVPGTVSKSAAADRPNTTDQQQLV